MSAVSMSKVAFARRDDTPPAVPVGVSATESAAHGDDSSKNAITDALGVIVTYFPAEVNVLYTSGTAAIFKEDVSSKAGQWAMLWICLVLAVSLTWFLYAARVRAANKPLPLHPRAWPWLEMSVSSIAFVLWTAALPNTPVQEWFNYDLPVAGWVVLLATIVLGVIPPVLGRTIKAGAD